MAVKYVKLSSVFSDRAIADIDGGTGWSISGLTVAEYPEGTPAATYVDNMIRKAVLVEATEAEFEAHEAANEDMFTFMENMRESKSGHQESTLQTLASEGTAKLVDFYNGGETPEFTGQASDGSSTRPDTSAGASEGEAPKFKGQTADELVDANSKDELIAIADEEGVDSSGTKQEIAERLVSV